MSTTFFASLLVAIVAMMMVAVPVLAQTGDPTGPADPVKKAAPPAKEQTLSKRVVTERDIISLKESGVTRALIGEKTIVTDLAKDLARTRGIEIVRN